MRILIRATNWVGDAILALPAIRQARVRFPDAVIAMMAKPYVADLYRDQGLCDELILYNPQGEHRGWSGRERLAEEIRGKKFDVMLLLQNAFDAAWLAWRAGVPERIGYARDGRSFLLTKAIVVPREGEIPAHEKFYYLELLRRAGDIYSTNLEVVPLLVVVSIWYLLLTSIASIGQYYIEQHYSRGRTRQTREGLTQRIIASLRKKPRL